MHLNDGRNINEVNLLNRHNLTKNTICNKHDPCYLKSLKDPKGVY